MSNCVINLSTDKYRVYSEIYRCLRKRGRVAISDITLKKALPEEWVSDPNMVKT
jgi:arsenite S-adenosylmethyltransferase